MAFDWRIQVIGEDGSSKPTVTSSEQVAAITAFEVFPGGDCGELNMVADPSQVDIRARDVIIVEFTRDSGSTWTAVYRGVVVIAGNERQDGLQPYRAVGLKQRLYEMQGPLWLDAGDVTAMATQTISTWTLVSGSHLPYGIEYVDNTPVGPATGFQLGQRLTGMETVGETFDALASSVGPFIVPSGAAYTYDGITYPPGSMVPGVVWGINADGEVVWRRAQHPTLAFDERDRRTTVDWQAVTAEQYANRVILVYGSGYDPAAVIWRLDPSPTTQMIPIPIPIYEPFPLVTETRRYANRIVPLDNPLDYMRPAAGLFWDTIDGSTSWTNAANALDGDPLTYAEGPGTGYIQVPPFTGFSPVTGILEVRYRPVSAGPLNIDSYLGFTAIAWTPVTRIALTGATEGDEDGLDHTRYFLISPAAQDPFGSSFQRIRLAAPTGTRLYEVRWWVPDLDVGERVSQTFAWNIEANVASVTYEGWGDITQTATVIPAAGGSPVTLQVERISYTVDPGTGLTTTYWAGGTYEPDLLSQRIVLERLIGRVSADNTRQPQALRRQTW